MSIKIGSAPDSWGVWYPSHGRQIPWQRFLDEIAEAGYAYTELGPLGYLPTRIDALRAELDSRHLKLSGAVAMGSLYRPEGWPELEREVLAASAILHAFEAEFLILIDESYRDYASGKIVPPVDLEGADWRSLLDTVNRVAGIAKERFGLKTVLHPHAETHIEYEYQIERFLEETDPDGVGLCFDTGHHAYRGGDPINFFRRHANRIPYLHLKSLDGDIRKNVSRARIPFAEAVAMDLFVEPAKGVVDFIALRDLLKEIRYDGFAIVEQDMFPASFDKPLPIAKRTRAYFNEIGIG